MQCPNCDFVLAAAPCPECGRDNLSEAKFCNWCGQELPYALSSAPLSAGSTERLSCPDGMCIGIIGENGLCVICGKSYAEPPAPDDPDLESTAQETDSPAGSQDGGR